MDLSKKEIKRAKNMFRSILIGLVFLSFSILSHSMQPINLEGTWVGSAYFNSEIDVISETIDIDVSEHFKKARFTVQYEIYNKKSGSQIPLLYVLHSDETATETSKNNVGLSISVDGHPATIRNIASSEPKLNFDDFFENYQIRPYGYRINVSPDYVDFIKANLSVGYHTIIVTYNAIPSYRDTNELTYEYNYDYSFDPIKLKQGFANTTISLNFDGAIENVSFQVFPDSEQDLTSVEDTTFTFKEDLPESIDFTYQRQFPNWVKVLVRGPALGFFIIFCVLFARWHIKEIKKTKDSKPSSILGYLFIASISIPLTSIIVYKTYRLLAYMTIKGQIIEDELIVLGFLGYVILCLFLAPFYSIFIYYKYYKSGTKS